MSEQATKLYRAAQAATHPRERAALYAEATALFLGAENGELSSGANPRDRRDTAIAAAANRAAQEAGVPLEAPTPDTRHPTPASVPIPKTIAELKEERRQARLKAANEEAEFETVVGVTASAGSSEQEQEPEEENEDFTRDELEEMTVADLKDICREDELPVSGPKADLIERILFD